MKQNNVPCEIIVDMMPVYVEGICSDESRKMIDEHLKSCSSCSKLCSDIPSMNLEKKQDTPGEAETFKKINRKFRLSKWKIRILGTILVLLVLAVGSLTAGQIIKPTGPEELKSFETEFQSLEVRKIAGYLASGNIDKYMEYVSYGELASKIDNFDIAEKIREAEINNLKDAYEETYKNVKVEKIFVSSIYSPELIADYPVVFSDVKITFSDGRNLGLDFHKGSDGLYLVSTQGTLENEFNNAMDYIYWHDIPLKLFYEQMLVKYHDSSTKGKKNLISSFSERFSPEYQTGVSEGLEKFYSENYDVTACDFSDLNWDDEKKLIYYNVTLNAKDSKGEAVLQTRIYKGYNGLIAPDSDEYKVFSDNSTDGLVSALMKILG